MSLQRTVKKRALETGIEELLNLRGATDREITDYGLLIIDPDNNLNMWKNYFSQLLNVYSVNDVREIGIHTAESLVPVPSPSEAEFAIANLKK
jgi:hypothetical protein